MSEPIFPLDPCENQRRPSSRGTILLERLMTEPARRETPLGCETAWSMKLKECVDAVAHNLHIDVQAAIPLQAYDLQDSRDMLFEVDTSRGKLEVLRNRSGEHTFFWKCGELRNA